MSRGYRTNLWTLPRVAALIQELTGVKCHPGHVWRLLGANGFSCQRPERRAIERDETKIRRWKRVEWPAIKKARSDGCTSVFIDESGLSTRPLGADLGPDRQDTDDPRDIWLEESVDDRWVVPVPVLFPNPSRQHQRAAGHQFPAPPLNLHPSKTDRHMERFPDSPQPIGKGLWGGLWAHRA